MNAVIESKNLTKTYNGHAGIQDLNFRINEGEIYGFLGPNGAGKSTTIRLLLNLIRPTSGSASIFGIDVEKCHKKICHRIGNLPGEFKLYNNLTGRYFLDFFAKLSPQKPVLQEELLEAFKLPPPDLAKKIKNYSRGMKQKLAIIQAMQHYPDLLIMDEPSEGLDPLIRNVLYRYIRKFKTTGKTVFFSSHNLAEVEQVCDRVGLVRDARLIAEESVADLKTKMVRKMEVMFKSSFDPQDFDIAGLEIISQKENSILLKITGDLNPLVRALAKHEIDNLVFPDPSLEETFLTFYN